MKDNVYLIPGKDASYHAYIASEPPTEDAVFLVSEGAYPVEYYYHRTDLNGSTIVSACECASREELISALEWNGECYHTIRSLWEFELYEMRNEELCKLFDAAYCRLMDIIDTAHEEMMKACEEFYAESYADYDLNDETVQPSDESE